MSKSTEVDFGNFFVWTTISKAMQSTREKRSTVVPEILCYFMISSLHKANVTVSYLDEQNLHYSHPHTLQSRLWPMWMSFLDTGAETGRAEVSTHTGPVKRCDFGAFGIASIRVPEWTWNVTELIETIQNKRGTNACRGCDSIKWTEQAQGGGGQWG